MYVPPKNDLLYFMQPVIRITSEMCACFLALLNNEYFSYKKAIFVKTMFSSGPESSPENIISLKLLQPQPKNSSR